ncbi:ankyrin repeat-containing protein [Fusarium subglutinans]|uniref:Ankyrin repeat-containing protein n=1 Tax=Gibberella subglutinans TaxID=42677 RepID=A0A8H5PYZ1_GIBSU|nr:ankyrin repeat-containing protein [Fusarium subglutinans]KAF5606220.1 ankyrin repeat-containing protein [Fusarium subglutinans]
MHGLGGLVVQNALDLSRSSPDVHLNSLESSTVGLLFMGTPHFGSNKARWGGYCTAVAKNRPISITCFYEELASPSIDMIVECSSAILPGYPSYGIHADHKGMTKYTSCHDKRYEAVAGELIRWAKDTRATVSQLGELEQECLRCLYFDSLESREESIGPPLAGTFSWIWNSERCKFVDWLKSGSGPYWITGRALSGKSTLLKYITNTPPEEIRKKGLRKNPIVASYFLGRQAQNPTGSTLEGIARALLWQILRKEHRYFDSVLHHFQDMKQSRSTLDWKPSVLYDILLQVLAQNHSRPLWIFLDGLDGYPGDLLELADVCQKLAGTASKKVRICISSRAEQEFLCSFGATLALEEAILKLEDRTQNDITMFATAEISRLSNLLDGSSRARLIKSISARANGLFPWVKLASRDVVQTYISGVGDDADKLLCCLDNLPDEITELYLEILKKQKKHRELALRLLGVVEFGKRSFTLREFAFILNPGEGFLTEKEINSLRRQCDAITGGLLEYRNGRVAFAHKTVSSSIRTLLDDPMYSIHLLKGCLVLGQACILLLESFDLPKGTRHMPKLIERVGYRLRELRSYSIQHWLHHLSYCNVEILDLTSEVLQVPLSGFGEWKKQDLDFIVSAKFAPGYLVSFHVGKILTAKVARITCKVDCPDAVFQQEQIEIGDNNDWIRAFLDPATGIATFYNPIDFRRSPSAGLDGISGHKKEIMVKPYLFTQI